MEKASTTCNICPRNGAIRTFLGRAGLMPYDKECVGPAKNVLREGLIGVSLDGTLTTSELRITEVCHKLLPDDYAEREARFVADIKAAEVMAEALRAQRQEQGDGGSSGFSPPFEN